MLRTACNAALIFIAAQIAPAANANETGSAAASRLSAVTITRIAMDDAGNSFFAEREEAFELTDFAPPAGPVGVAAMQPAHSLVFTTLAGKWDGPWHPAPRRQYAILLSGAVELEVRNGEVRQFKCGDILFLEDTAGSGHDTRVLSDEPAVFAIVAVPATD